MLPSAAAIGCAGTTTQPSRHNSLPVAAAWPLHCPGHDQVPHIDRARFDAAYDAVLDDLLAVIDQLREDVCLLRRSSNLDERNEDSGDAVGLRQG